MTLYSVVKCKECWKRNNPNECPMCFSESNTSGTDHYTIDYADDDGFCDRGEKKPRKVQG